MKLQTLPDRILQGIRNSVGEGPIKLHEPIFEGNESRYLQDCIDSTYVSSVGKYVDRFEIELAKFTGAKYAVSVVNGTAALHLALKIAGIIPGDEVLVQGFTFVATANAISYCGATAHFVDIEAENLGIDPIKLSEYLVEISTTSNGLTINTKTGKTIKALIEMHTIGHPSKIHELSEVAKRFNLVLLEDAAESIGSYYKGGHTGTFGAMGTLSFNGNKTITTGGGGAIITNNSELAKRAKHLSTTAKIPDRWAFKHDEIGYNYRMPNINAAIGCAQLEDLPSKLESKRELYRRYELAFSEVNEVQLIKEPNECQSNYWLQTLRLRSPDLKIRDEILDILNSAGFMSRPGWDVITSLKPFETNPSMILETANNIFNSVINIPSILKKSMQK
jgi:aminotransferase in exopolysaccharide biosynthesis